MKVLILSLPGNNYELNFRNHYHSGFPTPHYESFMLSGYLQKNRYAPQIMDFNNQIDLKTLYDEIENTDAVFMVIDWHNLEFFHNLLQNIDSPRKNIPLIAAGRFATLFPDYILFDYPVDFIIREEIEPTLLSILGELRKKKKGDPYNLKGISFAKNGDIFHNKENKPLGNKKFEELPYPAYEKITPGKYQLLTLETSRGYPYQDIFNSMNYEKNWRYSSPTTIYEKLYRSQEHHLMDFEKKFYYIQDLYFTAKGKRLIDLADTIKNRKENFRLIYKSRCSDILDQEFIFDFKKFTRKILFFPYCGYNRGLMNIRQGYNKKVIMDSARLLRKLEVEAEYNFVLGLPGETENEINKTISFAGKINRETGQQVKISFYRLLPGCRNWNEKEKAGLISPGFFTELPSNLNDWQKISLSAFSNESINNLACRLEELEENSGYNCYKEPLFQFLHW
ncbi:MAG: B12-binding domain-containing radical SAM protein [Vulcanimicrobiota bacterium]